jgi:hypothetical protein
VTDNLYVPHSVWHTPETWIFVSNLGEKVKALETVQESLQVVQDAAVVLFGSVARPQTAYPLPERRGSLNGPPAPLGSAQEWLIALNGVLATLGQLEAGMGKKLGLGEGVTGTTSSVSRTKRVKDWSTRMARKSFGVGSGKASSALGAEYVAALGAVCAGVRMLDGHACAVARLAPHPHRQAVEEKPIQEEDSKLVGALAYKYQNLSPQQLVAIQMALEKTAAALGTVLVPFILRDLGVLIGSLSDTDADWMGAML